MNDPINKSQTVPLTPDEAFTLFTTDIDTWWPKSTHSVKGAQSTVTFADHKDGHIIETNVDGTAHIWGTIIAYDASKYLAFSWHPGRPASEATTVTVAFRQTRDGTQIALTHGGFDILGPTADAVSTSYMHGWDMVIGCYASATKTPVIA